VAARLSPVRRQLLGLMGDLSDPLGPPPPRRRLRARIFVWRLYGACMALFVWRLYGAFVWARAPLHGPTIMAASGAGRRGSGAQPDLAALVPERRGASVPQPRVVVVAVAAVPVLPVVHDLTHTRSTPSPREADPRPR
jgi:hypothetical protein